MDSLHKIYVDSSPKGEVRWYNSTTGEIGKHKMGKGKGVHEAEFLAVQRTLEDTLKRLREKEAVEILRPKGSRGPVESYCGNQRDGCSGNG